MYKANGKRVLDFIGALLIIFITVPVFIIAIISIFITMGRPIFFLQKRPGINKKPFIIYKFRTMRFSETQEESDSDRITFVGKILRKLSIDELPQLINVIVGNMSLVGPRPLLMEYNDLYGDQHNNRFFVKPGITGLAQVNGRNQLSWDEKLDFDVYYVNNINLTLDLTILIKTIWVVSASVGFKLSGENEKFTGNRN